MHIRILEKTSTSGLWTALVFLGFSEALSFFFPWKNEQQIVVIQTLGKCAKYFSKVNEVGLSIPSELAVSSDNAKVESSEKAEILEG